MNIAKQNISTFKTFEDPNFKFNKELHRYTYHDETTGDVLQTFKSVSGFADNFKEAFNGKLVAENLSESNPLYGKPVDEILKIWKEKGRVAAALGTEVHEWIENFYKTITDDNIFATLDHEKLLTEQLDLDDPVLQRVEKFREFYKERLTSLKSVFQEVKVFSRKWGYAGTIDGVFSVDGKQLIIGDYKTNKEFTTDSDWKGSRKRLFEPFEDVFDNKHNNYSIQVSLYRLIIEEECGIEMDDPFLLWIPPKGPCKAFKAKDYRDKIRTYLNDKNLAI